jgi:hypothetical protein
MKRIILTESQYKRLVKQNLNERVIYSDPKDEYDATPNIRTYLDTLSQNLMIDHNVDTYVKKIEDGVVYLEMDKYSEEQKNYISNFIDIWVDDLLLTIKNDEKIGDIDYFSGKKRNYRDEEITDVEDTEEIEDEDTEEIEDVEVSEYLSSDGIPILGDETYGLSGTLKGGDGGNWGGSMGRALWFAKIANEYMGKNIVSSQKRDKKMTADDNVSDHYKDKVNSYAVDLQVRGTKGDELLKHIMSLFANGDYDDYVGSKWFNKTIDGYRYQIGWKSDSDHYDHIHVGVRKI